MVVWARGWGKGRGGEWGCRRRWVGGCGWARSVGAVCMYVCTCVGEVCICGEERGDAVRDRGGMGVGVRWQVCV